MKSATDRCARSGRDRGRLMSTERRARRRPHRAWRAGRPLLVPEGSTWDGLAAMLPECPVLEAFPCSRLHDRAVYQIGCVLIYEDTYTPWSPFEPMRVWYWTGDYMAPAKAELDARNYPRTGVVDAPYSETGEKMLEFNELETCVRWLWDHRAADLLKVPGRQTRRT